MQKPAFTDPAFKNCAKSFAIQCVSGWPEVQLLFSGWIKRALIRESVIVVFVHEISCYLIM